MTHSFLLEPTETATVLLPLSRRALQDWIGTQDTQVADWVASSGFVAAPHTVLRLPGGTMLLGIDEPAHLWSFAAAPRLLPGGDYRIGPELESESATRAALGWTLGCYRFDTYKSARTQMPRLCWPAKADRARVLREERAIVLVRNLVNTPANDLGPAELAAAAQRVADDHGATTRILVGEELLGQGYRTIHAVGRASAQAPRLVDIRWGDEAAPRVTLVGKGVCFDTGGLNLKPTDGMRLMKKDMGGAAHALALAQMIMDANLPVRLRVLLPVVENAVAGTAMRPLDVIRTHSGRTVEIGNTDAEGRLILCDALSEASSERPDLLIDMATLTGAARVALGPDLPALFCNDEETAAALASAAAATGDPLWRLPLWQPYAADLEGKTADLNNISPNSFAGAIYAALFLQAFVARDIRWIHLDLFGWNPKDRPGRPEGGEAQALRAAFHFLQHRYTKG